uniref:Uncharacterized protein n=1 Tax=Rhodopseudomonas palustris (strain DX-1) TaxID=652103 RepID=E6VMT9_RHOPX
MSALAAGKSTKETRCNLDKLRQPIYIDFKPLAGPSTRLASRAFRMAPNVSTDVLYAAKPMPYVRVYRHIHTLWLFIVHHSHDVASISLGESPAIWSALARPIRCEKELDERRTSECDREYLQPSSSSQVIRHQNIRVNPSFRDTEVKFDNRRVLTYPVGWACPRSRFARLSVGRNCIPNDGFKPDRAGAGSPATRRARS